MTEKTHQATPKKIDRARQDGDVARSAQFTGALVLLMMLAALWLGLTRVTRHFVQLIKQAIVYSAQNIQPLDALQNAVQSTVVVMLPMLSIIFVAAILLTYLQVGPLFTIKPVMPQLDRLNMGKGFERLFNKQQGILFVQNGLKLGAMFALSYALILGVLPTILRLPMSTMQQGMMHLEQIILASLGVLIGVLVLFGVLDFLWQRHTHGQKLMMTTHERKQEYRQNEGDPDYKNARLARHIDFELPPALKSLTQADVVIVHPTYIAVAICFWSTDAQAPIVLHKGRGVMAQKIKDLATIHQIPIIKDAAMARGLIDIEHIPDVYLASLQRLEMILAS